MEFKFDKPETTGEMLRFMRAVGVYEGLNWPAEMVSFGWADTEDEAVRYLESLGIFPNDD